MSTYARSLSARSVAVCTIGLGVVVAAVPVLLTARESMPATSARSEAAPSPKPLVLPVRSRPAEPRFRPIVSRDEKGGTTEDAKNRFLMMLYLHGSGSRGDLWSRR
jgi:hypothetical protein